jgi:ribosomal protein S12 methylthiotransferase accessory factor
MRTKALSVKRILDGTHRTTDLSTTLSRITPCLKLANITRVANVTGLDDVGIPTVMVCRPLSRSLSVSQGKGLTLEAAKVSGIMESLEQWHAERPVVPLVLARAEDLRRNGRVIDVSLLPRYQREFHESTRILWTVASDLRTGEPLRVPYELVHLDLTLPLPAGSGYFHVGSNGLASGNTLAEALTHAVWELFERDAVSVFMALPLTHQARRRVRLESVDDPACVGLLERFEKAGIGAAVWDVTSDLGVPAFLCSIVERSLDPLRRVGLARGFGCHADRGIALSRSLCEAAQSRLTRITGSREDIRGPQFQEIRSPEAIAHQQRYLDEEALASHEFTDVQSLRTDSFEDDLAFALDRLEALGLPGIAYVNLSRDEFPISVVRAIVPGLEGSVMAHGYSRGQRARRAAAYSNGASAA